MDKPVLVPRDQPEVLDIYEVSKYKYTNLHNSHIDPWCFESKMSIPITIFKHVT